MPLTHEKDHIEFTKTTDIVVCDPCYIFTHRIPKLQSAWSDMCSEWFPWDPQGERSVPCANHASRGTITYEGIDILYSSTAYGDGTYKITETRFPYHITNGKNHIAVDAGMICILAKSDLLKINPDIDLELCVQVREFIGMVESTGKGFTGDLEVITDGTDEEDES
jgi:hypothetical protein